MTNMASGILFHYQREASELHSVVESTVPIIMLVHSVKIVAYAIKTYYLGNTELPHFHSLANTSNFELSKHQDELTQIQRRNFPFIACKEIGSRENGLFPGWTVFISLRSERLTWVSHFAYLPVIGAPAIEMSTIKAMLPRS